MTEQEWLACTDPTPMLEFLRGKASERKLRLFAVVCCRRAPHLLPDRGVERLLDVVERYADGLASEEEVTAFHCEWLSLDVGRPSQVFFAAMPAGWRYVGSILQGTVTTIANLVHEIADVIRERANDREAALRAPPGEEIRAARLARASAETARSGERATQSSLLRDIFGALLFRSIATDPARLAWNESKVRQVAQAIYDERAFDRMPILADALEEAGCTGADILTHCRLPGEHLRGCWVVDLLLGKQ
jgi:hypothetical protein